MKSFRAHSHARYPDLKTFSEALARSREDQAGQAAPLLIDNEWAASSFLVELLRCAERRSPRLDRQRAQSILARANSPVSIDHLESRTWVRFVLDRLRLPWAVRQEVRRRGAERLSAVAAEAPIPTDRTPAPAEPAGESSDPTTSSSSSTEVDEGMSAAEASALELLMDAVDEMPLYWMTKADAERSHANHVLAHRRTPPLDVLVASAVISPFQDRGADGYRLSPNKLAYESPWSPVMGRVLGLYWEELAREAPRTSDAAFLQQWLDVAIESHQMVDAPDHMSPEMRARFIDSAVALILAEPDLLPPSKEPERLRWEHEGRFGHGLSLRAFPSAGASLLELHAWWKQSRLDHLPFSCRSDIDALIATVVLHDDDSWAKRTIRLLEASRERPHLMRAVTLLLGHGAREQIAGLVAHLETVALGLRLLSELQIAESPSAAWEDFAVRQEQQEARKTSLWQAGLTVFFGTLHETPRGREAERARAVHEVLLIAAEATVQRRHPVNADIHQRGAEARLRELFTALGEAGDPLLSSVGVELHRRLKDEAMAKRAERPGFESMPVAAMKVLFWLLRAVPANAGKDGLDAKAVAETLVNCYGAELDRSVTDGGEVVWWLDDVPEALTLPWSDLAVALHRIGEAKRFVGPAAVPLDSYLRTVPAQSRSVPAAGASDATHGLYRSWIHKLRLHARVLISVHDVLRSRAFDPVLSSSAEQRKSLLAMIERRLTEIVEAFSATDADTGRPSIFSADNELKIADGPGEPALAPTLVRAFNRFSAEGRDRAFASWIDVEDDPTNLLTIIDDALPWDAQRRATDKLATIDIERFLEAQLWIPRIQQVAETASAAGKTDVVEKVLKYGDERLEGHPKKGEWDLFAYRMRLVLAYHKGGGADEIDRVPRPPSADAHRVHVDGGVRDPAEESKLFYRGLALLKSDPERARDIFAGLLRRRSGYVADANNWFAAAINVAEKVIEPEARRHAFLQALHDWESVVRTISASGSQDVHSLYNRLVCLDGAERDDDFDVLWAKLDVEQKAQIDFVALAVRNAGRRGLPERVAELLAYARPYHLDPGGKLSERFEQVERDAKSGTMVVADPAPTVERRTPTVGALRSSYLELYHSPAELAVQIVGGEGKALHEYLWENLCAVAKELLGRGALFNGLKDEDKYNDLVVSLLRMRLAFIGWQICDQTRGGISTTGDDVGERDWVIRDRTGERAILEALRLDSVKSGYIDDHVDKAVFNYNPGGLPHVYIVVYYEGKGAWDGFWKRYVEHVEATPLRGGLLPKRTDVKDDSSVGDGVRTACLVYEREGYPLYVYHVALKLA